MVGRPRVSGIVVASTRSILMEMFFFNLSDMFDGFYHRIRIERDALDSLADEELGEVGKVGGSLPADTEILLARTALADDLAHERAH